MHTFFNTIFKWLKNKYILAISIFLLFILIFDDSNLFYQYKLYKEQKKLAATSSELKLKIKELQKINDDLQKNPLAIEKIAREKYGMKRQNETIFLFPETK